MTVSFEETLEQIDEVKQRSAKTVRGFVIVFRDVGDDIGEVV